jgi:hypothetical protein
MAHTRWSSPLEPNSDTHLYIDMSGGVLRSDWEPIVLAEVMRLKALSVELDATLTLRLTAFSHELADDAVPIMVTGSSPSFRELGKLLDAMPTVDGGTNFGLVWDRVNTFWARGFRDNVIISDLEWSTDVLRVREHHPVHLRYIPIERTRSDWKNSFVALLKEAGLRVSDHIAP